MPFSGGTYTPLVNFVTASASPPVTAATLDSQFTDIATGLSTCLLKDGTSLPSAAISFNTQDITGVKSITAQRVVVNGATVPANGMYLSAANTLALSSNTTLRWSVNSTGNHVIAAPTAGIAVAINGFAGSSALTVYDAAIPKISLLANAAPQERFFASYTEATSTARLDSDGSIVLAPNNTTSLTLNSNGQLNLAIPSSGTHTINTFTTDKTGLTVTDAINYTGTLGRSSLFTNAFWVGASAGNTLVMGGGAREAITVGTTGAVNVLAPSAGSALTVAGFSGTHSTQISDSATNTFNAGYLEIPQNIKNTAYTPVLSDAGKHIYHSDGTARTYTIPANGTVAYPIGTTLTFVNDASAGVNVTIAITTDTMYWAVDGTTGSRTLARYGIATALKVTATRWTISGTGLS